MASTWDILIRPLTLDFLKCFTKNWSIFHYYYQFYIIIFLLIFIRDCIFKEKNEKGGHFHCSIFGVAENPFKSNSSKRYSAVFLTLKLGQGGLGTRNWKVRNLFSWKSESFIWRYGKYLRHTNQTSYFRFSQVFYKKLVNFSLLLSVLHYYFSTYFYPGLYL